MKTENSFELSTTNMTIKSKFSEVIKTAIYVHKKNILLLSIISLLVSCNQNANNSNKNAGNSDSSKKASLDSTAADLLKTMTPEQIKDSLAKNPSLFIKVAGNQLKWEAPVEPTHIAGPIYFVGTAGLSSFLITTPKGHILLYTGMSTSGPMIEKSINKLGFNPADIKILLTGHAHIDHVGGHAYLKKISGAQVVMIDSEKDLIESGGKTDFHYASYPEFLFEPVKVDRILHDGDKVSLGGITMTALHTPGHTKGGTTWIMDIVENGKKYNVVFPDGTSINPGYRISIKPSYPGIEENYAGTLKILGELKPDIWLSSHTDFFDFEEKRKLAETKGVTAYVDPEGYRKRIASEKDHFEAILEEENNVTNK